MHKLSRAGLDPEAMQTAEQLLTDYAPSSVPPICTASPSGLWTRPTRTAQHPSMINSSTTAGIWS